MLKDTTPEIEKLQNELWMQRSTGERAQVMFDMFAVARRMMINSLPKSLSDREVREQIYFRTYGEPLPEDFFKDDE